MADLARVSQSLLTYLCLCLLLLSSSAHLALAMSMDLDNDDDFDIDDRFFGEVAPARRLYGNGFTVQQNSNTFSNRSGSAFCRAVVPADTGPVQQPVHRGATGLLVGDAGSAVHGPLKQLLLSDAPALKILRLSSNNFTGQIPLELSQLSQLQLLDLAHNGLTGLIPIELGNLESMKHPKINSSIGSLDGSTYQDRIDIIWKGQELIFQRILELMTGIDLSGNSLSHYIPEELTNLQGLRFLNLSRNNMSCTIPKNIGSLKYLESLDLSWNELSGPIPPGMSSLQSLNTLNLSNNHLSGKIPTRNQLQTLIDPSIYGNNPDLCGPPLNISCQDPSHAFDEGNGGECQDQWLYYCVIAGIVFGFWLWYGMLFSITKLRYSVFLFVDRMQYKIMQKVRPINHFSFERKE
ncbi:unnamed protein product [Miscanthus lutarioriparius]|uniref:Uncharacterized protein n=1 Tax=Miscanthus lutarioriparius TaxID=422564 RepID=A0A811MP80_9POAL|nr:unnamed protein product [Miscanthus lutarioriparius]